MAETIPGGYYLGADGTPHNAKGDPIAAPKPAPAPAPDAPLAPEPPAPPAPPAPKAPKK